ncbi:hypothetical protein HDU92_000265, partial [Lobulomyces angularis]
MEEVIEEKIRAVFFLARAQVSWQVWKETEPELHFFFERNFKAQKLSLKLTAEDKCVLIEVEVPSDQANVLEKEIKDGIVKLSKFVVTIAPTKPQNKNVKSCLETLEEQLIELEIRERARSIDIKVIMERLQFLQMDMFKKLDLLDKKVEENFAKLDMKCDKMEKII